jgi:hypothetical protein
MEQVTAILAVCHRLRVPVVTRGAGTGLSGGALPLEKGVLLVMARFKEILDINPVGRRARVQPGVRNLAISQHRIISTTHRTLPHKSPVPLAATWQKMPAASTA